MDLNEINSTLQTYVVQSAQYIIKLQSAYGELIAHQFFIAIHLMFFVLAFALLVRGYRKMFVDKKIDLDETKKTSKIIALLLLGLWISGAYLIYMNSGFDVAKIKESPEMMAKLFVVLVLTANTFVLSGLVLPSLHNNANIKGRGSSLIAAVGAVNIVSWAYTAFIGATRVLAPTMTFNTYIELYGMFLALGTIISMFTIHRIIKQHLTARFHQTYVLRQQ